jgi:23S rRNA pseudouridine1911/1915/1917 synthase
LQPQPYTAKRVPEPPTQSLRVLYEDNHLIAVYKPSGMLTQGDSSGEPTLMDWVKRWLAERYDKRGRVFLGLVHRLDRPVAGVILFAKTSKAASRVSQQFRERTVHKLYVARLEGIITPASGHLTHFIEHSEGTRAVQVGERPFGSAKPARLRYETRSAGRTDCVVRVELETGRKHQIRAQFARAGHPIIGDRLYGSRKRLARSDEIALCAVQLTLRHPTTAAGLELALPDELWPASVQVGREAHGP